MEQDPVPKKRPLFDLFFNYLEKRSPSDRFIIYTLAVVFIGALAVSLISLNDRYATTIPARGGVLTEGIIGTPRFVNPALAMTRVDNDLTALLYSGLMRIDTNGTLVPDLAQSVTVSEDGLVYNVVLRDDITFHDNTKINAEDVAYTIALIQNPDVKSPIRGNWSGVSVEVLNERELNLVLQDPYTPFLENLTLGIMPKHIWNALSIEELPFSQHNAEPIGSGPYRLEEVTRSKTGLISGYVLTPWEDGRASARIKEIHVSFFVNEDELITAYTTEKIMSSASFSYETLAAFGDDTKIVSEPLPRVFSVFFNQNKSAVLRDTGAREALSAAIDRDELVDEVLLGYGEPVYSPLPAGTSPATSTPLRENGAEAIAAARAILLESGWNELEGGGWSKEIDGSDTVLAITIATANNGIFEDTAYYLDRVWSELGVEVSIELYEQTDLVQSVIRPRDYQALLYGMEIGRALDLYPFWHSSQREDPGLNVALYANITTDALLTKARTTQDPTERIESIRTFEEEILSETPAVFLFSPSFVYVMRPHITTADIDRIARPHERFSNIRDWYMREESVWNIFTY